MERGEYGKFRNNDFLQEMRPTDLTRSYEPEIMPAHSTLGERWTFTFCVSLGQPVIDAARS